MRSYLLSIFIVAAFISTIFASKTSPSEKSTTTWTPTTDGSPTSLKRDNNEEEWTDAHDGSDKGYASTRRGEHIREHIGYHYSGKTKEAEHIINSDTEIGKQIMMETEGTSTKHADASSALGKDVKAKTFGFFDYRYKQPEYHMEQYYTDEKHGENFGADHHHRAINDHISDSHDANGWNKHEIGYVNDARGLNAEEIAAHEHAGWDNDHYGGYGNGANKAFSLSHTSINGDYNEDDRDDNGWSIWNRRHEDGWEHDRWYRPERHEWDRNNWADRGPNGWRRDGWEEVNQQPWIESRARRGSSRKNEPSWRRWNQRPSLWSGAHERN